MTSLSARRPRFLRGALAAATLFAAALSSAVSGAQVANRLAVPPSGLDAHTPIAGSVSGRVKSAQVLGHLAGETPLTGMSLVIKPSAQQQAELTQLLADQQDPASPQYHKWLSPEQFGQRFGLSDADLSTVQNWLSTRGFTVDSVAPSRNRIVFSGTAATVEAAFATNLQRFRTGDQEFFENSTEVNVPSAFVDAVGGITGLSSFHLSPPTRTAHDVTALYTGGTGYHYIVPWDFRQIYGINTLMSQGFDGTGATIGVIGQSTVDSNQLTYFQQKIGQTLKLPTMVLVPNTGAAGQYSAGDEGESELDLEYASGSAPGATVFFIYTGLGRNNGVFDALIYGITNKQAQILTLSYGGCETTNASFAAGTMEPVLAQASSQGQTVVVSSGDTGAASCEPSSNTTTTANRGLSVSYPASSPNVTAVGGTQLNSGAEPSTSNQYWSSTNNSFKGSATGYIPETSWNDTVAYGALSSTGGGASVVFGKPSWQAGPGVPADNKRDVPDVAFPAAVEQHAYIVCTVGASCQNNTTFGSTDGKTPNGGLIGGTSASAPNFAALLAVVEQASANTAGLGNINPRLYQLAAGSSASTIFHDITTGNNIVNCAGGSTGCSSTVVGTPGTMGYSAGVGYDLVTGLGSLDASALNTALKAATPTKLTPTVSVSAATNTPPSGTTDLITFSASGTGSAPTGNLVLTIDGATVSTVTLSSTVLSSTYLYTVPTCTGPNACPHTVVATYAGDGNYTGGSSTVTLTVPVTTKLTPTVALSASTLTPALGASDVLTVQVTGTGATPTGTVTIAVDSVSAGIVTLTNGSGSFTYTATCTGSVSGCTHTVVASYSGDTVYNAGVSTSTTLTIGTIFRLPPLVVLTPATTTPALGATDVLSVTVAGSSGTPTGSVALNINGVPAAATVTLVNGTGSYNYVATCSTGTTCTVPVIATYTGDAVYTSASSSTATLTVGSAISVTAANSSVSVSSGSTATNVINVSSTGFNGTVSFKATVTPSLIGCYNLPSVTLSSTGTASSTMTIATSSAGCTTAVGQTTSFSAANTPQPSPYRRTGLVIVSACLLGAFTMRRRRPAALLTVVLSAVAFGVTGCSTNSAPVATATAGSYTVTVAATGTPASGSTVTTTTTFTLVVK